MQRAGFVLAGGASTRMGRDKALLLNGACTLLESTAAKVALAAGEAVIIGAPERYQALVPYRVFADRQPGCGPISGLETALELNLAEWNLVVACDMPSLKTEILAELFGNIPPTAKACTCVVPLTAGGLEPLCAVYHASCLAPVRKAVLSGCFKLRTLLLSLNAIAVEGLPETAFANVNTPGDWDAVFPMQATAERLA